jgi:hypothetical protein
MGITACDNGEHNHVFIDLLIQGKGHKINNIYNLSCDPYPV